MKKDTSAMIHEFARKLEEHVMDESLDNVCNMAEYGDDKDRTRYVETLLETIRIEYWFSPLLVLMGKRLLKEGQSTTQALTAIRTELEHLPKTFPKYGRLRLSAAPEISAMVRMIREMYRCVGPTKASWAWLRLSLLDRVLDDVELYELKDAIEIDYPQPLPKKKKRVA